MVPRLAIYNHHSHSGLSHFQQAIPHPCSISHRKISLNMQANAHPHTHDFAYTDLSKHIVHTCKYYIHIHIHRPICSFIHSQSASCIETQATADNTVSPNRWNTAGILNTQICPEHKQKAELLPKPML